MKRRTHIAVVRLGGTIDSVGKDREDLTSYGDNHRRLGSGQLLQRIPEASAIADVTEIAFKALPSPALIIEDLVELVALIHEQVDSGVDGVVITHGTSTLEETAYFLHLTLKRECAVVLVGGIRPPSAISPDGDANLINAIRVAADPASLGLGVLVVMNDAIFGARDVTKAATYRLDAFRANDLGPLGFADADHRVVFYHRPTRAHTLQTEFDIDASEPLPRVDVVTSHLGADGAMVHAAVQAGAQGIVLAGSGEGSATPDEVDELVTAAKSGVLVVLATRTGSGRTVRTQRVERLGWCVADNLQPWKARILTILALTRSRDIADVQRMFDVY